MLKLEQEIFPAPFIKNKMNNSPEKKSYPNILFLQVLGNKDVTVNKEEGYLEIQGTSREEIEENLQILKKSNKKVEFPLIKKAINELIYQKYKEQCHLYLGIVLTEQTEWAEKNIKKRTELREIISCDGHWWNDFLKKWVEQQKLNMTYCPLIFEVTESNIETGASDWEGMAKNIEKMLLKLVEIDPLSNQLFFKYKEQPKTKIDEIIIQYSSGTPALSSALYLWGIELNQKVNLLPIKEKKCSIKFAYLSRQDSIFSLHDGEHWQWRFKVPQLERLLEIQDFSGVLGLLTSSNKEQKNNINKTKNSRKIYELLKKLDRANSFNLKQLNLELTAEEEIIERISLAIWSEKAFREKGHWLQWYLRLAGALELSLLALVKAQCSDDSIRWEQDTENNIKLVKLKYTRESNSGQEEGEIAFKDKNIVFGWLENGSEKQNGNSTIKIEGKKIKIKGEIKKINQHKKYNKTKWKEFKEFYGASHQKKEKDPAWQFERGRFRGFSQIRNKLYHTLQGDFIDQELDDLTQKLGTATHPEHPASIAVKELKYILQLANLLDKVEERVNYYETMVEEVKKSFFEASTEKALNENF